jgi:hypothetical protein
MTSIFPVIASAVDTSSESYQERDKQWQGVLEKHNKALEWCVSDGQLKYVNRHMERGMLLGIHNAVASC